VPAELAQRVEQVKARLEAAEIDSRVCAQLDRIRLEQSAITKEGWYDSTRKLSQYAVVLRDYGIDLDAPEEAAARVRASRVRQLLLVGLEDWFRLGPNAAEKQRIETLLGLIEPRPDSFRANWWAAIRRGDGAALKRLLAEVNVENLPATTLEHLAADLEHAKETAEAERILRTGRDRFPGDFWLNFKLAHVLSVYTPRRPAAAVGYYQAALAIRGPDPVVYNNLAVALLNVRDTENAIHYLKAARRLNPDLGCVHNNLGLTLWLKGDRQEAIGEYQAAIQLNPGDALARNNLGLALKTKGDLKGAFREYEQALQINPKLYTAHSNRAGALYARRELELSLARRVGFPFRFGLVAQAQRDLEECIRASEAAIRIEPEFADSYYNLAIALKAKGDLEGAIENYRTAIRLDPRDPDYHVNLGSALSEKGDWQGAIRAERAALLLAPKLAVAHHNLGHSLLARGNLDEAISELQAAIQLDPKYARAYFHLGEAYDHKRDFDQAIAAFQSGLVIDPNNAKAHYELGTVLGRKGNDLAAISEYRTALRISPSYAEAHYNLGNALLDQEDLAAAAAEFRAAIKSAPHYAEAHCNLGHALMRQWQFVAAARALRMGHKLGSQKKDWRYPSAEWVQQAERLANLEAELPKLLSGESRPGDAASAAALASFCQEYKQRYAAACRLYSAAFVLDARLADDAAAQHRYNAARAGALAGSGRGHNAVQLDDAERVRLRQQALDWLRADLVRYAKLADGAPAEARAIVHKRLKRWLRDGAFVAVRGYALAKLPEAERQLWQLLWDEVAALARDVGKKN